jgi:hypothetical protein
MRRQVLVSVFAVGASLAAWSGTASAHDYGYGYGCCEDYAYYGHYRRHGSTAPQTNDRYNNDHRDSAYAPAAPAYRYNTCCTYDYSYAPRRRYYHHTYSYHYERYRHRHYRDDYGYRRWHRDDYDD